MRRTLVVVGIICLLAGGASPLLQHFVLRAGDTLESGAGWALLFYVGTFLSIAMLLLAIPSSQATGLKAMRIFFLAGGGALLCFHAYALARISWVRAVGPRAVVIVPDNFSGMFGIYIKNVLTPGLATAGKVYTFQVPADGAVQAESGWIALTFTGRSDPYTTQILSTSGKPLLPPCEWVYDEWMEQITPTSASSRSRLLGIICRVGPGLVIGNQQIERDDAHKFFREHFKIEGLHNHWIERTAAQ